jgi:predicted phage terminase large subunit-like protein
LGTYDYSAQHGQRPLAMSGGIFKREWFKRYKKADLPPVWAEQIQSWDLAFKKKEDSDFVVGEVWARLGTSCYLRAERRGRMGYADSKKAVRAMSSAWPDATAKLIEAKANGPALIDEMRYELPGLVAVENNDGVLEHAWAIQAFVEAGNVFILDTSEWPEAEDWLDEVCGFPKAGHDDRVAAFTQAIRRLMRNWRQQAPVNETKEEPSEAVRWANQRF